MLFWIGCSYCHIVLEYWSIAVFMLSKFYKRKANIVTRQVNGEFILVPVVDNIVGMDRIYTLNEVGSFIWEQLNGSTSIEQIAQKITEEFEIDFSTAKTDVIEYLKSVEPLIEPVI